MNLHRRSLVISDFGFRISERPHPQFRTPHSALRNFVGFTLIELMLVIVIIGVLAAMVVPRLAGRTEQAKIARTKADIAAIGLALDLYELDLGQYPSDNNLDALVNKPSDGGDHWKGPYLKKGIPKDPWGQPYTYKREQSGGRDYQLSSYGPDGKPGSDDITNAD